MKTHDVQFAMAGSDTFGTVPRAYAALVIRQWRAMRLRVKVARRDRARAYYCSKLDECVRIDCTPRG